MNISIQNPDEVWAASPMDFFTAGHIVALSHLRNTAFAGALVECQFDVSRYRHCFYDLLGITQPERLVRASKKRQAEFIAGRVAALAAFSLLKIDAPPPTRSERRFPQWPPAVTGSISHSGATAVCAVGSYERHRLVGIDIEEYMTETRAGRVASQIGCCAEQVLLANSGLIYFQAITLLFSAKEALFKALNPHWNTFFGFHDSHLVAIEQSSNRLWLQLTKDLATDLCSGDTFELQFCLRENDVICLADLAF